jgi:peptidoglycan/LPS O-acetylase OafA/YrhL
VAVGDRNDVDGRSSAGSCIAVSDLYEVMPYVVSGMLLLYATQLPAPAGLQAVGQYLGQLSYPLYLFHLPALITAYALLDLRASWALVGCALLTTLAAYHVVQASAWQRARHWAWLVCRGIAGRIAVSPTTTR